ncbi:hypothetical protein SRB521_00189 [Intestinimonas butyriciproducens]|nr:hypothetical protein SRB521_00189 [Intestinimonas butyriciproducens]
MFCSRQRGEHRQAAGWGNKRAYPHVGIRPLAVLKEGSGRCGLR